MTKTVYTVGYSGRKPDDLRQFVIDLDAVLLDIRFSPVSRVPYWNKKAVAEAVGGAYQHVKALGNVNYKGGPVQIVDYSQGKAIIEASECPVILMCACGDPTNCHRTVVAEMLRKDGYTVTELNTAKAPATPKEPPKPKPAQLKFF